MINIHVMFMLIMICYMPWTMMCLFTLFVELLLHLYCDSIYAVTRTTRGVSSRSLARFKGVPMDHMHG